MPAKKKDIELEEEKVVSAGNVLGSFLKERKEDHYNFEDTHDYKIPCSSLLLTSALGGGIGPGAHKFTGLAGGGKTSCALDFMFNFLKTPSKQGYSRRGIYIKAEGRLSENVRKRSGIIFVDSPEEWIDGTCFVFESNIYEAVFDLKRRMINIPNLEIFFLTDSTDSLIKKDDAIKADSESITVGGGALMFSVFLKKVGLAMAKRGHIDVYISQIRDTIKINQYEVTVPKQGKSSGPRALEHQGEVVLEFLPRFNGDLILEGEKKSKPVGHFCKCKIIKTDNENYTEVKYPIRYGQTGAKSVWVSYETVDMLLMWELAKKKGAWISLEESFKIELISKFSKQQIPEMFHGIDALRKFLEDNEDIMNFAFSKLSAIAAY